MKILIIGAGVIGSVYASKLAEAGVDITLFVRNKRLKSIEQNGLVLRHYFTGEETRVYVKAITRIDESSIFELIIIIIRGDQWKELLPSLVLCKNTKTFLFLGNNPRDPDELIDALGKERVMLGFGGVAGYRENDIVYYSDTDKKGKKIHVCIGELDGSRSERVKLITEIFSKASYPVWVFKDVVSWLKSHMIIIMPIMGLLSRAGWDQQRVVKDTQSIRLAVKAFKEMIRVFKDLKIPVYPERFIRLSLLPDFILIFLMKKGLTSKGAEIGIFGHAKGSTGKSEMKSLSEEFNQLLKQSSVPTPAWDILIECIRKMKIPDKR